MQRVTHVHWCYLWVAADVDNAEQLKGFFDAMQALVRDDKLVAYHDKGDGGLFVIKRLA